MVADDSGRRARAAPDRSTDRAAWGTISREVVVDAAVELVAGDSATEFSIRTLAARLNVSPMALYRHVDSKDDLLEEVVNTLLAQRWRPRVAKRDWRRWIIDAADRLRRFLVEQPVALQVYLRRPVTSDTALRRMEACLAVLSDGLGDAARARSAYAAIQTYTIGFAALEAAREAAPAIAQPRSADTVAASAAQELAAYPSPAQFRAGLEYLLAGVESD